MSRLFKNYPHKITQIYKKGVHNGIDLVANVNGKSGFDYIIAHSDGVVVSCRNDYNKTDKTGNSYGNYVKIKHDNGYYTMYGHLKYNSVEVKVGDRVTKGQVIGFMGNTGHSNGAHLHWEVRNEKDVRIDPTPFLDSDLPNTKYNLNRILKNGCKGTDVKELQNTLNNLGFNCGKVDSKFGKNTDKGVKNFQKSKGLKPVDGIVAKDTAHALNWTYKGK